MPNARIGFDGDSLLEQPESPKIRKRSASNVEIRRIFHVDGDQAEAAILAFGVDFGDSFGAPYPASVLQSIDINPVGGGGRDAEVVFLYQPPEVASQTGNSPIPGTVVLESDANMVDIPLGQLPTGLTSQNYDNENRVGKGDLDGVETFQEPQPIFRRTEILASFTFTEANVVNNVGKVHTPAQMDARGLEGASENKWLKVGLSIRTSGSDFEKIQEFQFAENGWETPLIYKPAGGA